MEKNIFIKIIKDSLRNLIHWIKNHPNEFIAIAIILLVGSFFRLYKISQYLTFLGDEGRDAIIVRRLLKYGDPILIGPGTSIGNMYLGPLYYYLMAPALFLANYSPTGPAVQIAILGVITILLVYLMAKEWFGVKAAIISALLYAIAPTVIIYSRSSWNPNIMPFFSLISIYSIWKIWEKENFEWLIVLLISFAFVLQSHYLGLLMLPIFGLFYLPVLIKFYKDRNSKDKDYLNKRKNLIKYSLISLACFTFLMSPLVIFDARHNWLNFSSMKKFFTERQTTVSAKPWTSLPKIPQITTKIFTRVLTGRNENLGNFVLIVTLILLVFIFIKRKKIAKDRISAFILIFTWLFISIGGLGLYKQEIYDHYYGFFFAAPFLLFGGLISETSKFINIVGKTILLVILGIVIYFNLLENPLKYSPNMQMQRSIKVAEKIKEEYNNTPFNLAVIAERNYEDGYQYFLEKMNLPVVDIDAQRSEETIKEQLFVVCELPKEKCNPTNSPKAEVANFGWSKVKDEWEIFGVHLFKLTHLK